MPAGAGPIHADDDFQDDDGSRRTMTGSCERMQNMPPQPGLQTEKPPVRRQEGSVCPASHEQGVACIPENGESVLFVEMHSLLPAAVHPQAHTGNALFLQTL